LEQNKSIEQLFIRYLNNQASSDELQILFSHFAVDENEDLLKELITKELETYQYADTKPQPDTNIITERIFEDIQKIKKSKVK
jgi:hypothetical protein